MEKRNLKNVFLLILCFVCVFSAFLPACVFFCLCIFVCFLCCVLCFVCEVSETMRRMTRALEHSEFVDRLEDVMRQHGDVSNNTATTQQS